jgi:hypothetical protein
MQGGYYIECQIARIATLNLIEHHFERKETRKE